MIVAIIGPSGVGKTAIANKLTTWDKNLCEVVSHTTREKRENEVDGIHYHFVDRTNFQMMEGNGQFVETNEYKDNMYGVSKSALRDVKMDGKVPVVIIDVNGADNLIREFGEEVMSFFIEPPSIQELEKRLKKRGDSAEEMQQRLALAEDELPHAFKYQYRIKNDVLKTAANRVLSTIHERAEY